MSLASTNSQAEAETAGAAPIVDIRALRKSFGSNEVLKGIDLQVRRGEVIAIIGKSGSGKSTLLRCINGLEEFQAGSLSVDGQPLLHGNAAAMRALRQHVGMIFQSFNLFPHLSVGRNVMLAPGAGEEDRPAPRAKRRRGSCSTAWASAKNLTPFPTSSRAASSSAWRLPAPWRWSPACCCATRSPPRSTPSSWARCCAWWSRWPTEGMTLLMVTHEMALRAR